MHPAPAPTDYTRSEACRTPDNKFCRDLRPGVRPAEAIEFCDKLGELIEDQANWSQNTFGNDTNRSPSGALRHLMKEAQEAIDCLEWEQKYKQKHKETEASNYLVLATNWRKKLPEELADCFLLILDASRRSGFTFSNIVTASLEKMKVNKSREWPKSSSDGLTPVEHKKEAVAAIEQATETKGRNFSDVLNSLAANPLIDRMQNAEAAISRQDIAITNLIESSNEIFARHKQTVAANVTLDETLKVSHFTSADYWQNKISAIEKTNENLARDILSLRANHNICYTEHYNKHKEFVLESSNKLQALTEYSAEAYKTMLQGFELRDKTISVLNGYLHSLTNRQKDSERLNLDKFEKLQGQFTELLTVVTVLNNEKHARDNLTKIKNQEYLNGMRAARSLLVQREFPQSSSVCKILENEINALERDDIQGN